MRRAVAVSGALLVLDLALIVLSGGFSIYGPVSAPGLWIRITVALAVLALRYRLAGSAASPHWYGYLAILLLCLPLLHLRAYRLRGDGMWYYAYARSLAFDGDLDFSNEYRRLGVDQFRGSPPRRKPGPPPP